MPAGIFYEESMCRDVVRLMQCSDLCRVELYKVIGNVAVGQEPEPVASQGTISEARQKGKRKSKDCV